MDWIESAKADHKNGLPYRAIAKKYGKAYGTVWNAINETDEAEGREEPKPRYEEKRWRLLHTLRPYA